MKNRAPARRNCVYIHHRSAKPNSSNYGIKISFKFSFKMGHIRRCAAHIKPYGFIKSCYFCCFRHADHASGWAGKNCIFPLETVCISEAAIRLHKHKPAISIFAVL